MFGLTSTHITKTVVLLNSKLCITADKMKNSILFVRDKNVITPYRHNSASHRVCGQCNPSDYNRRSSTVRQMRQPHPCSTISFARTSQKRWWPLWCQSY